MSSENMKFWEKVKKTDPNRVKPITGKQYKGNSPQPYYLVERMTEEFGMCGIGWGINILNERMERLTDTDVLHVAVVELWYKLGEQVGTITQVGQTKAAYKTNAGSMMVDEDAPKKSVTDAITKCMSYLGFAGDIFSGQWDDSKYVQELNKEFSEKPKAVRLPALTDEQAKAEYEKWMDVKSLLVDEDGAPIVERITNEWGKLPSNVRSAIKRYGETIAAVEQIDKAANDHIQSIKKEVANG